MAAAPTLARQQSRLASTAQTMGQTATSTARPQKQQQLPPELDSPQDVPSTAAAARSAVAASRETKVAYARAPIDFEGGMPHNGYSGHDGGQFVRDIDRLRAGVERIRSHRHRRDPAQYDGPLSDRPHQESKYGGFAVESRTEREEKSDPTGVAPSLRTMWAKPCEMHDKAYCKVTRTYEASPITTTQQASGGLNSGKWTRFPMGNFNTVAGTDGFYADVTAGEYSAMCLAFHLDSVAVTGVTGTTGPRVVRGGPTSTSYVTGPMTQGNGWTGWNNDMFEFLNVFRYMKLDKLELQVKFGNYTSVNVEPTAGSPYDNWASANNDPGVLYIAPWSGQPGIVNSYTTGDGAMTTGANGAANVRYWESQPGVMKVPYWPDRNESPYRIRSCPIHPITPDVVTQSSGSGQPVTGSDQVVNYQRTPTVDSYNFVAGSSNLNAFGWTIFWSHPDFTQYGSISAQQQFLPWIEVNFRATMTWWGLLPPDETAGSALSSIVKLPGVAEAMQNWFSAVALKRENRISDLQSSLFELKQSTAPKPQISQQTPLLEEYVQVTPKSK